MYEIIEIEGRRYVKSPPMIGRQLAYGQLNNVLAVSLVRTSKSVYKIICIEKYETYTHSHTSFRSALKELEQIYREQSSGYVYPHDYDRLRSSFRFGPLNSGVRSKQK